MFEEMTFEYILNRALSTVPNSIDKRQGSIIYDAIAPACAELAQIYIQLDYILNCAFADTATRKFLLLKAKEIGIEPKASSPATIKVKFNTAISINDRFSLNGLTYFVTELINDDEHSYNLQCETNGTIGNDITGKMLPVKTITGLTDINVIELAIAGEDEEDTEAFRTRYFETVNNSAFGGNKAQYKQWVKDIDGVGQCKVVRTPDGGGTVGIIFTSSEDGEPSVELIQNVKKTLDPTETEGQGDGLAPIGHVVSVAGVDLKGVTINIDWLLANGADEATVTVQANEIIKDYIREVNAKWEDNTKLTVSSYQLIARLAEITEIQDIASLTFGDDTTRTLEAKENEIFNFETLVVKGA